MFGVFRKMTEESPQTGDTYLLLFHESLYIPGLQAHLLNPVQLRMQGITVNDVPLTLLPDESRIPEQHSILSWDPPLHIPLALEGVMSGFTVREPTWEECNGLDQERVKFIYMTSSEPWAPHSETFSKLEGTLREKTDHVMTCTSRTHVISINSK